MLKTILKLLSVVGCVAVLILYYYGILYLVNIRSIDFNICSYNDQLRKMVYSQLLKEYAPLKNHVLTNAQYRVLLEDELDFHIYFYKEEQLEYPTVGRADPYMRIIRMTTDYTGQQYARTFTHEIMHIKKMSYNEQYICFETFKFLYEHENPYLRAVGLDYAIKQLYEIWSNKYDIEPLIMYYFLNEGD